MISKVLKIIMTLLWPIIFLVGQFIISGSFMLFYMINNSNINWEDESSNSILLEYMNNQTLLILFIECVIFIPIFYFVYKKYCKDKIKCSIKSIFMISLISFMLSSVLNFIIIGVKYLFNIEFIDSSITFTTILATGFIGPILEEYLFRGIVYGKFLNIFKDNVAFYLSIVVFAIFHTGGIFQILFASVIGYYLTYIYRKYHDIKISIMAHIIVNTTSILISPAILLLF